jgi:quercetin dioxygenase-like cupin family protein
MTRFILVILLMSGLAVFAGAQDRVPVKCIEDSPERRGEEGCSILTSRPFVGPLPKSVYWHIDRFDSLEAATAMVGPNGVATAAHGGFWLMTVESKGRDHHGGRHVAWMGPLSLPPVGSFTMRVQSSLLTSGTTTPVHTHSGPEVFYIVSGEQCLDTPQTGHRLTAGRSFVLPAGVIHQGRVAGPGVRRALALILHDSARPGSTDLNDPQALIQCK